MRDVARRAQPGRVLFRCPGCEENHQVPVIGAPGWERNQSLTAPTFRPSIMVHGANAKGPTVCHSFVTEGRIQFLSDCTHRLAGQTVDLPAWP